jgi:hypothetical protein
MFGCRKTRHAVYVSRNIEARWRNDYCRGKAISAAYNEYVSVASALNIHRACVVLD